MLLEQSFDIVSQRSKHFNNNPKQANSFWITVSSPTHWRSSGATGAFLVEDWALPKSINLSFGRAALDANLRADCVSAYHTLPATTAQAGSSFHATTWHNNPRSLFSSRHMMLSNLRSLWTKPESWQCFTAERSCLTHRTLEQQWDLATLAALAAGKLHQQSTFFVTKTPTLEVALPSWIRWIFTSTINKMLENENRWFNQQIHQQIFNSFSNRWAFVFRHP